MKLSVSTMRALDAFKEVLEHNPDVIDDQLIVAQGEWRKAFMRLEGIDKWNESSRRALYRAKKKLIDLGVVKQVCIAETTPEIRLTDGYIMCNPDLQRL